MKLFSPNTHWYLLVVDWMMVLNPVMCGYFASLYVTECLAAALDSDMPKTVKERIDGEATRVAVFIRSMGFKV